MLCPLFQSKSISQDVTALQDLCMCLESPLCFGRDLQVGSLSQRGQCFSSGLPQDGDMFRYGSLQESSRHVLLGLYGKKSLEAQAARSRGKTNLKPNVSTPFTRSAMLSSLEVAWRVASCPNDADGIPLPSSSTRKLKRLGLIST